MRTSIDVKALYGACVALLLLIPACKPAQQASDAGSTSENAVEASASESAGRDGPEVVSPLVPTGEVTFNAIADTDQQGVSVQAALRNGAPVPLDSNDWQASFITEFDAGDGPESCTSAMIGPGVMLTAAHCIPDSRKIGFSYGGARFSMDCVRHPKWESGEDASADYGLCMLSDSSRPFTPASTFRYETVDVSPMARLAQVRAPVILTGYGCTSDQVAQRRIDGRYRIGKNVVVATSDTVAPHTYPDTYFGPNGQRDNLITTDTGANICPGDSGGPAFSVGLNGDSSRKIIAVNSRVFFDPNDHARYGASLLAAMGSADFGNWARKWLTDRQLSACGLAGAPPNCRS